MFFILVCFINKMSETSKKCLSQFKYVFFIRATVQFIVIYDKQKQLWLDLRSWNLWNFGLSAWKTTAVGRYVSADQLIDQLFQLCLYWGEDDCTLSPNDFVVQPTFPDLDFLKTSSIKVLDTATDIPHLVVQKVKRIHQHLLLLVILRDAK